MKLAFLFPGQGSQVVGMGRMLAETYQAAAQVFLEAEEILQLPIRMLCWEGPEDTLRRTENAQVALFVSSMAALKAYQSLGAPGPTCVAGHSLGEYSALCASGAIDFESALKLVRLRGELMARADSGTMAAVLGLDASVLEDICRSCVSTVVVANYNSPDQLVLSGTPQGVLEASERANAAGAKRVIPLAVAGAFHSPLMEVASADLAEALHAAPWGNAQVPVLTNLDAQPTSDGSSFAAKLSRQLSSPVRWVESMRWILEQGETTFVEMGTGKVLCGLVKKLDRRIPTYATEDPAALQKVQEALSEAIRA